MYQEERIYQILKLLKEKKTMTNQEIMDYFHISRDTARRDIVRLVNENLAVRTHGGITLNDEHKAVFFDTSTTIAALCQYVSQDIEAYSHSLDNIEILSNHCPCHMIGGKYFKKNRYMYGSQTLNTLDQIYFDLCFVGVAAIMEDGIYVEEFEDAAIKRKLARRSQNVCLVADHSKFNKKSTYKALDFQDIDIFITDFLPEEYKDKINCQIIEVKEEK